MSPDASECPPTPLRLDAATREVPATGERGREGHFRLLPEARAARLPPQRRARPQAGDPDALAGARDLPAAGDQVGSSGSPGRWHAGWGARDRQTDRSPGMRRERRLVASAARQRQGHPGKPASSRAAVFSGGGARGMAGTSHGEEPQGGGGSGHPGGPAPCALLRPDSHGP